MNNLVLIDGHSLAYRMYFALERTQMHTTQRFPTWGVYGFFKAMFDLLQQHAPDGIAIAFDAGKQTFRNDMHAGYKANRKEMPDSLSQQLEKIYEGVGLLGIPIFQIPNYEADDVIGTLARQAAQQGIDVTILTGDQDAFQVIDPHARISILMPSFKGGLVRYDRQGVFEKWGVYPEQVTDFKGLKGDTSDNIPGVPGIGDKTAAKLLADYQTLENVLDNTAAISGKKLQESLIQYREQALLSKDLATIRYDAPVDFVEDACHLVLPDIDVFLQFLSEMEFRSFIAQSKTLLQPFLVQVEDATLSQTETMEVFAEPELPETENGALPQAAARLDTLAQHCVPHHVVKDLPTFETFLTKVRQTGVLALDVETSGLDFLSSTFAGIALSWSPAFAVKDWTPLNPLGLKEYPHNIRVLTVSAPVMDSIETLYVPIGHENDPDNLDYQAVLQCLKHVLEDQSILKIAHNAKFERNMFRQHDIHLAGPVFDTMVASYVLNSNRRHGLKSLAYDVLGYAMQEIEHLIGKGKKQIPFTQVTISDAAPYAACDSHVTLELAGRFVAELQNNEKLTSLLYETELPLVEVLAEIEYQGVSLDTEYLKTLGDMLGTRLAEVEKEIYDLAGETFNLNSPKQVGDILFEKLQLPTRGMTKSKANFTTNAKVIESLSGEYPIAKKLLNYRQLFKLKSTYVDSLPTLIRKTDNRLHTSFNQTVAATGRLSSSDPNLQNIPIRSEIGRSIRQAFVPAERENWTLMSVDYSQIELRLLAHFSEDPHLLSAFQAGEDIHQATAALVFDVALEDVTKEMRYQAKAVNFGIIYGQTAFGLSNSLGIPTKEAAEFINKYFIRYGKVRDYIDNAKAATRLKGYASTLCYRVRDFSQDLNSNIKGIREFAERAAFNMPLQGSAADLIKIAMIRLHQALQREKLQSKLILQVHDEVVLEVYQPERERVRELVLWAMALEQPLKVPLEMDISEGPTWMEVE